MRNVEVHIPFYTRVFQMGVFQVFPTKLLHAFLFSPVRSTSPTHCMPDLITLIVQSELKVFSYATNDKNRLIVGMNITTMKE
jgi:hypothetical protein